MTLREALGARKTFIYVYDYGDDWRHKVKVEKIVTLDARYEEFLAALADPNNPEHDELKEWIGGSFDPTAFDLDSVNQRLSPSEH